MGIWKVNSSMSSIDSNGPTVIADYFSKASVVIPVNMPCCLVTICVLSQDQINMSPRQAWGSGCTEPCLVNVPRLYSWRLSRPGSKGCCGFFGLFGRDLKAVLPNILSVSVASIFRGKHWQNIRKNNLHAQRAQKNHNNHAACFSVWRNTYFWFQRGKKLKNISIWIN